MKNIKYIASAAFILAAGASVPSCSYLDVEGKISGNNLTIEKVFESKDHTDSWLAQAFVALNGYSADYHGKDWCITIFDDCFGYGDRNLEYKQFRYAEYDENFRQNQWTEGWFGVRQASIMIKYIHLNKELTAEQIVDYRGQARFVRAYAYWKLLQKYGPLPIVPDDGVMDFNLSYEDLALPRKTYDECVDYIVKELEIAASELPLDRDGRNIVRPTRGAALAARAKVLLYGASPINNPGGPSDGDLTETFTDLVDDQGKMLMAQTYNEEKWARAAAAARDVIELGKYQLHTEKKRETGTDAIPPTVEPPYREGYSDQPFPQGWQDIDPMRSYQVLFNGEIILINNEEMIFTLGQNSDVRTDLARHNMPLLSGGYNCHFMTGKMCDAYEMNDGTPFDEDNPELQGYVTEAEMEQHLYPELGGYGTGYTKKGIGVNKRYTKREPRFYASCAYNGVYYDVTSATVSGYGKQQVFNYRGERNGYSGSTDRWLRTGIGVMKYICQEDTFDDNAKGSNKWKWVVGIRYADVLLWYAEALNELTSTYNIPSWDGSQVYSISRDPQELHRAIRPIRVRAGLPDYDDADYADAGTFRDRVRHERMVEFFAENSRYFDVRRWKIAAKEESEPVYGCDPMMSVEQRDVFHQNTVLYDIPTTFNRRMYFWPIQHVELQRNLRMTQNPGWTTYE